MKTPPNSELDHLIRQLEAPEYWFAEHAGGHLQENFAPLAAARALRQLQAKLTASASPALNSKPKATSRKRATNQTAGGFMARF